METGFKAHKVKEESPRTNSKTRVVDKTEVNRNDIRISKEQPMQDGDESVESESESSSSSDSCEVGSSVSEDAASERSN